MRLATIYGDVFAERVVGCLINFKTFCQSCEPTCSDCRIGYGSFVGDIVGIHRVSPPTAAMIEDPDVFLQGIELHECDLLMLIGVHHDLLASADELARRTKAKAVIAPIEDPNWVPPGLRSQVKDALSDIGIQSAFPKPFCTLEHGEGSVIDEFIDRYKIGRPECNAELKGDMISEVTMVRSAPCGSTWYVAQKARGSSVNDKEHLFDVIAKAHHAYPCTASMMVDREVGDALLHIGGYMARSSICDTVGIECSHVNHSID